MASEQEFAYRASAELEAAVREGLARIDEWERRVLLPWQDAHPDNRPLWVRRSHGTPIDRACVGFEDTHPTRPVPKGLSRNQKRHELIPIRGEAGEPWRNLMDEFNTRPGVADAFALHGVELSILDVDASRLRWPAILISTAPGETGLWMKYQGIAPRETEHLTSIPVSEFHLAMEALDARDKERKGEREAIATGGPREA